MIKKLVCTFAFVALSGNTDAAVRGVFLGDSFTANGSYIATLLSNTDMASAVNMGVQGRNLSSMASAVTTDAIGIYAGNNLVTNAEFTTDITGWTKLSATGTIEWESTGKLKTTNTQAGANASVYSPAITVAPNTTYELTVNWSTYSTATSLNVWVGVTGSPFNSSVLSTKLVTRPYHTTFTTGSGVTTIYVGFQNGGGVVNAYSMVDSVGIRAYAKPDFINVQGGINGINTGGLLLRHLQQVPQYLELL